MCGAQKGLKGKPVKIWHGPGRCDRGRKLRYTTTEHLKGVRWEGAARPKEASPVE